MAKVRLPRLHGHAKDRVAGGVADDADDAASDLLLVFLFREEEGCMRVAISDRNEEVLGVSDGNVGAELARRLEQGDGEHVSGHEDLGAGGVRLLDGRLVIIHGPVRGRVLHQNALHVWVGLEVEEEVIIDENLDAEASAERHDERDCLRVHEIAGEQDVRGRR